jgi:hypothetical protein
MKFSEIAIFNESNTTYNKKKTKYKTKMSDRMGRIARGNIDWTPIWTRLKKIKVTNKLLYVLTLFQFYLLAF